MKAMVLAAGYGKRLRPLTVYRAKPALPLLGTPLVEYTLAMLARAGVRELVVNLHYLPETIRSALQGRKADELRIHYSYEPSILGTAGGLKQAEPILDDGTFLLVNGDTLLDSDLAEPVEFHRARGGGLRSVSAGA
jgi:NDP-sugar pyrophosphorylase family protein